MSAPFEVTIKGTDYEDFRWSDIWEDAPGSPFPFASYTIEYVIADACCIQLYRLTVGSGITVDAVTGLITFDIGAKLPCGTYQHACRKTTVIGGLAEAVFDGPIIISKGPF